MRKYLCLIVMLMAVCLRAAADTEPAWQPYSQPCLLDLASGAVVGYKYPVKADGRRVTVTVCPFSGNPDVYVGKSPVAAVDGRWLQSCFGPLMPERISFEATPGDDFNLYVVIRARSATSCALGIAETPFALNVSPAKPDAVKVEVAAQFGDAACTVANIRFTNTTPTWYEVSAQPHGVDALPYGLPDRLVLGPKQMREFNFVAIPANSDISITVDRTTPAALTYLTCDMLARVVSGGQPLAPDLPAAATNLVPKLQAFVPVGEQLAKGDIRHAGLALLHLYRTEPQAVTALADFYGATGLRVSTDMLSAKALSGFGAISATVLGISAVRSPARETITLSSPPTGVAPTK